MKFKQGTMLDQLLNVQRILDSPEDYNYYGIFRWEEDIFTKDNGLFRPAGRIILPMTVEGRNPKENDGAYSVAFTYFEKDYFEGLQAPNPDPFDSGIDIHGNPIEYQALCDWFSGDTDKNLSGSHDGVLIQTYTKSQDPYVVVRPHIGNVLSNLEGITQEAKKVNVEHLVKRAFIEY